MAEQQWHITPSDQKARPCNPKKTGKCRYPNAIHGKDAADAYLKANGDQAQQQGLKKPRTTGEKNPHKLVLQLGYGTDNANYRQAVAKMSSIQMVKEVELIMNHEYYENFDEDLANEVLEKADKWAKDTWGFRLDQLSYEALGAQDEEGYILSPAEAKYMRALWEQETWSPDPKVGEQAPLRKIPVGSTVNIKGQSYNVQKPVIIDMSKESGYIWDNGFVGHAVLTTDSGEKITLDYNTPVEVEYVRTLERGQVDDWKELNRYNDDLAVARVKYEQWRTTNN